jgi:Domain of unknown function (DUF4292)
MLNFKQLIYWFFTVMIVTFFFSGCKQVQKIVLTKRIKHYSVGKVIKLVNEKSLRYQTLTVKKAIISLSNEGKETSIRGSYKIRRDSIIQVYAQKLSIPVAKLEIKTDSFRLVNYIDQQLYVGKNNYLSKLLGFDLDFNIIQALLSNQIFSIRQEAKEKDFKDFVCDIEDGMYKISSIRDRKVRRFNKNEEKFEKYRNRLEIGQLIKQDIYIDTDSFVVKKMVLYDLENNNGIRLEFSKFEKVMEQWFPGLIEISLLGQKKVELSIELSKVTLDDEKNYLFSVSPKFTRKLVE